MASGGHPKISGTIIETTKRFLSDFAIHKEAHKQIDKTGIICKLQTKIKNKREKSTQNRLKCGQNLDLCTSFPK